jgi:hypothetical protein
MTHPIVSDHRFRELADMRSFDKGDKTSSLLRQELWERYAPEDWQGETFPHGRMRCAWKSGHKAWPRGMSTTHMRWALTNEKAVRSIFPLVEQSVVAFNQCVQRMRKMKGIFMPSEIPVPTTGQWRTRTQGEIEDLAYSGRLNTRDSRVAEDSWEGYPDPFSLFWMLYEVVQLRVQEYWAPPDGGYTPPCWSPSRDLIVGALETGILQSYGRPNLREISKLWEAFSVSIFESKDRRELKDIWGLRGKTSLPNPFDPLAVIQEQTGACIEYYGEFDGTPQSHFVAAYPPKGWKPTKSQTSREVVG